MTNTKYEVTSWAIVITITRPDGTWFDRTITDFPEHIGIEINDWLTDYIKEIDEEAKDKEKAFNKYMSNKDYELI